MKGTARFYTDLGELPTSNAREAAIDFHARILTVMEMPGWTHQERTNLQRLEKKWGARARGEDERWALVGSKAGRLPKATEQQLRPPADPEWGEEH